jgi:6-phosphogluconolactonase (cycloisomerase 2 family)
MQDSGTFGRSKSFTSVRVDPSASAPDIAAAISGPSRGWRRLGILGIASLVFLAACGSGTSKVGTQPPPPASPKITSISPNTAVAGGAAFTLTINGTNFVAGSTVNFGGSAPATTFVNSMQLTAAIPAASIASTGTPAVTVTNPAPGGGTSNAMNFIISSGAGSVPTLSSMFPSCVPAGEQFVNSINNQLTLSGLNFEASSVVRWNGTDLPTTLYPNSMDEILIAEISASDIAAAGTATVTVFNPAPGGGTSNSLTFTTMTGSGYPQSIAVAPSGKFAYVADAGCNGGVSGYVSMYTIDPTTGALTSIGPPVSSQDTDANSVTVDPSGKFVYLATTGDDYSSDGGVAMYSIDATTGGLTSIGEISGNCPGLCVPLSVAVDPSGKFAYVPNGDGAEPNNVAMYAISATTGVLKSIGKTTIEGFADSVTVDPSGQFAYVAIASGNASAGSVSTYTINAATGTLAYIGTVAAGINPGSLVVDPTGKFAYAVNFGSGDVSMYTINVATGALTSTGTIDAGTAPVSMALDPAGKFAYVVDANANHVSMYTIDASTGALTSVGTIATGQSPTSIAILPSGNFAYVTNSASNDISIYSVDAATGALTLIGTTGT